MTSLKCAQLFYLQAHTLLFVQTKKGEHTKTYAEFESVNECIEGRENIFNHLINILCIIVV